MRRTGPATAPARTPTPAVTQDSSAQLKALIPILAQHGFTQPIQDYSQIERANELLGDTENEVVLGQEHAPLVMHYFQDLSCGMCKVFIETILPSLKRDYIDTGRLKIVFRDFPLGMRTQEVNLAHAL